MRSRRAYNLARQERATALEDRAERAERALEEEARRRVIEERMRIARELHDVVAHHIAVINVQAGVAAHLLRDNPTGARGSSHARPSRSRKRARRAEQHPQRDPPVRRSDLDHRPAPHPRRPQRLIADFAKVGLEIEWHTAGARRPVAPAVGLAAYRIIQESLTNAHRHGCASSSHPATHLRRATRCSIEILNDIDADRPDWTATRTRHRRHARAGRRRRRHDRDRANRRRPVPRPRHPPAPNRPNR